MIAPWVSASIALAALLLTSFNFWYSVIRPWRRSRWANPAATLELFSYQTESGWHTDIRIVVTNVGEAKMSDVTAEVRDVDGNTFGENLQSLWPKMPLPALYKDQNIHLKFDHFEMPKPASVMVRWRDGRRKTQEREIWLSYRRV
jgi:hypothetical protein